MASASATPASSERVKVFSAVGEQLSANTLHMLTTSVIKKELELSNSYLLQINNQIVDIAIMLEKWQMQSDADRYNKLEDTLEARNKAAGLNKPQQAKVAPLPVVEQKTAGLMDQFGTGIGALLPLLAKFATVVAAAYGAFKLGEVIGEKIGEAIEAEGKKMEAQGKIDAAARQSERQAKMILFDKGNKDRHDKEGYDKETALKLLQDAKWVSENPQQAKDLQDIYMAKLNSAQQGIAGVGRVKAERWIPTLGRNAISGNDPSSIPTAELAAAFNKLGYKFNNRANADEKARYITQKLYSVNPDWIVDGVPVVPSSGIFGSNQREVDSFHQSLESFGREFDAKYASVNKFVGDFKNSSNVAPITPIASPILPGAPLKSASEEFSSKSGSAPIVTNSGNTVNNITQSAAPQMMQQDTNKMATAPVRPSAAQIVNAEIYNMKHLKTY